MQVQRPRRYCKRFRIANYRPDMPTGQLADKPIGQLAAKPALR